VQRHRFEELGIAKEDVICHVTLLGGIRAQVEARLRGGGRGFVQKNGPAGEGGLDTEDDISF